LADVDAALGVALASCKLSQEHVPVASFQDTAV
jgi:hypothetical protein